MWKEQRVSHVFLIALAVVFSYVFQFRPSFVKLTRIRCAQKYCDDAINRQPPVLVLPGASQPIGNWTGTICRLGDRGDPNLLPFVGQLNAVTDIVSTLCCNLVLASDAHKHRENINEICLIANAALPGAGKTKIASVVSEALQRYLDSWNHRSRVVQCTVRRAHHPSGTVVQCTDQLWSATICAQAELKGLAHRLRSDMCLHDLLRETRTYLEEHQLVLFLHLDDFLPFLTPTLVSMPIDSPELFSQCWERILMPIMTTPRVCLYLSGRMPYFGAVGRLSRQPVLSPILELWTDATIHAALSKIFLTQEPSNGFPVSPDGAPVPPPVQLTSALDRLLPVVPSDAWCLPVAQRLQEVTGGVPQYVCHGLHLLLRHPPFKAALFEGQTVGVNSSAPVDPSTPS